MLGRWASMFLGPGAFMPTASVALRAITSCAGAGRLPEHRGDYLTTSFETEGACAKSR